MGNISAIGLILLIVNFLTSYYGFKNQSYFDKHSFRIDGILGAKEYSRLITSGFLHTGWVHLIFNMLALSSFSDALEPTVGWYKFLLVYFVALVGGNLLSLFIHRNHEDYSAVGASGAIAGVIFACIAIFPEMEVGLIFIPYKIKGWIFGVIYVLISIYGIKAQRDNIGHEAHLGGGLVGMIVCLIFYPEVLQNNPWPILAVLAPAIFFLGFIVVKPEYLLIPNFFNRKSKLTKEEKYNADRLDKEKELNRLLEKIHKSGYESLSAKEKKLLQVLSGNEV